jgi:hypothetical protein
MKNLLVATVLLVTLSTSAFADPANVNYTTLYNFKAQFRQASNVTWIEEKEFTKATFTWNNEKLQAFFSPEGEMIGTSKNITLEALPVNAKRIFAKKFEGFIVKEAIRFEGDNESAYYLSAENEKESVILKVNDKSSVSVFKKTKK